MGNFEDASLAAKIAAKIYLENRIEKIQIGDTMNCYAKLAHEIWVAPDDEKAWGELLRARIAPLVDELKAIDHSPYCPRCLRLKKDGHAFNCPRQAALAQWTDTVSE